MHCNSFNYTLSKIFKKTLLAILITKDSVLKNISDCVLTDNEERCSQNFPYIHSIWRNLHVRSGCVCIEDTIALANSINDAAICGPQHAPRQLDDDGILSETFKEPEAQLKKKFQCIGKHIKHNFANDRRNHENLKNLKAKILNQ